MLVRHDLVTPEMIDAVLNKPPLMYWLPQARFTLGARDEWAVASVLAAMASVFFTCRLGARLFDDAVDRGRLPDDVRLLARSPHAAPRWRWWHPWWRLSTAGGSRRRAGSTPHALLALGWASLAIGFMAKGAVPVAVVAIPVVVCTVAITAGVARRLSRSPAARCSCRGRLARRRRHDAPRGLRRQPAPSLLREAPRGWSVIAKVFWSMFGAAAVDRPGALHGARGPRRGAGAIEHGVSSAGRGSRGHAHVLRRAVSPGAYSLPTLPAAAARRARLAAPRGTGVVGPLAGIGAIAVVLPPAVSSAPDARPVARNPGSRRCRRHRPARW
jgi:hypothetical protein